MVEDAEEVRGRDRQQLNVEQIGVEVARWLPGEDRSVGEQVDGHLQQEYE